MEISEQLKKEKKIKQESNRIKKIFKDIPKDKVKVLEGLIQEASFMKISLEDLRDDLLKNGFTELFVQGDQSYIIQRANSKVYTTLIQRYGTTMKQLIENLPIEEKKLESNKLAEFLQKGKIKK